MRAVIALVLGFSLCAAAGCASSPAAARRGAALPRAARINHLAFFKLKDSSQADELIADCDRWLASIPGVVSYYAGKPLDTGRGARVDGDYDVGFYVGFDSQADYARYVEHPQHKQAVEKWQPRWQWIRVHDVLDETP